MEEENSSPIIELASVYKTYGKKDAKIEALSDVSLCIQRGEFVGVVGDSGSGKSTFLNMIGALDRPSQGDILFNGRSLIGLKERVLTRLRRQHISVIFQFYNLIPTLTALENVMVSKEISDKPLDPKKILARLGLAQVQDHFPEELSGGQQQRVAIARALTMNTPVLLCDEPTGALDSESSESVMKLIKLISEKNKKTVVFVTHNPVIKRYCDRLLRISDGKLNEVDLSQHV